MNYERRNCIKSRFFYYLCILTAKCTRSFSNELF